MKKIGMLFLSVFLVSGVFLGKTGYAGTSKVIKWTGQNTYHSTAFPPAGISIKGGMGAYGEGWAEWVKDISGGKLLINLAPPGSIVSTRETLAAVGQGALDVCSTYFGGYNTGNVPEANIEVGPPFAWKTAAEMFDFLYFRGAYKLIQEAYHEKNVHWLPMPIFDYYGLASVPKLNSLKDLKGLKVRCAGLYAEFVREFGASPTVIPPAEYYMALKLGTIDAVMTGASVLASVKLQEVVKCYVYDPWPCGGLLSTIINLDKWNALPGDLRELIDQNSKYQFAYRAMAAEQFAKYALSSAQKNYGVEPIAWSSEDAREIMKKALPLWDKIAKKNARCGKLIEILKAQARDLNRID